MPDEFREGPLGEKYIVHDDASISHVRDGPFGHRWIEHPDGTWTEVRKGFSGEWLDHSDGTSSYRRHHVFGGTYFDHSDGSASVERGSGSSYPYLQHTSKNPSYFHGSGFAELFEGESEIPRPADALQDADPSAADGDQPAETGRPQGSTQAVSVDYASSGVSVGGRRTEGSRLFDLFAYLFVITMVGAAVVVVVLFAVWGQEQTVEWLGDLRDRVWSPTDDPVLNFLVNAGVMVVTFAVGALVLVIGVALAAVGGVLWALGQIPEWFGWLWVRSPVGAVLAGIAAVGAVRALWRLGLRRLIYGLKPGGR